jgi:hypothetical protein
MDLSDRDNKNIIGRLTTRTPTQNGEDGQRQEEQQKDGERRNRTLSQSDLP